MKKSTWIILAIAAALGLVYAVTKKDKISVGVKRLELPTFETAKIDTIEIMGRDKILLKKEKDQWKLQIGEGEKVRLVDANKAFVDQMLDAAAKVSHSYYVTENAEKHEELGLKGDKATSVTLKASGAPVWALILGKNGTDSSRYARVPENNSVYAVRGSFFALTRNNLNDWRERNFWQLDEPQVVSLSVERPHKGKFTLTKDEQEVWKIAESEPALSPSFRVDANALASFVRSQLNFRASGFIDDNKQLSAPMAVITAKSKDGKSEVVEIYAGDENNYWAKSGSHDQIFTLLKNNFDRINKPLDELRELSIMSFDKNAIVAIKLAHAKLPVLLKKSEGAWEIIEPKKLSAKFAFDPASVDSLLSFVADLRAHRLAQAKDKPTEPNWQKVPLLEMTDDSGKVFKLYASKSKQDASEYMVRGNIDSEIYLVKNPQLKTLQKGLEAFKKEEFVLPPSHQNIQGFESLPIDVQRKLLESAGQRK